MRFKVCIDMLKIIIEKELLARFSDTTFVIACILSAMLIFLSFYLSVCNYSDLVMTTTAFGNSIEIR